MRFDESIFKAYDIRGIYGKQFDAKLAYWLGRAFVTFLECKSVAIGRDSRPSSEPIFKELSRGILDQGANVVEIGQCTTPMLYFSVGNYKYDAGIMITASHNPAEYNGFKLVKKGAVPIGENNGMQNIKGIMLEEKFSDSKARGQLEKKIIMNDYCAHVLSKLSTVREMTVVVDTANGMGGLEVPKVFESLPIKLIPLYFDIDMTFPNHEANPLKFETLKALQQRVVKEKAQLGVALDGDCDRVFFVDEKGDIVPADFITALVAEIYLKHNPGAKILYDLRSSWIVKETIEKNGGVPGMCRVGHAFIKQQMRDQHAVFAGELSGHFYFADNFYTESGIITTMKIIELLAIERKPLSELVAPLKKYFQSGEINFTVKNSKAVIAKLENEFKGKTISHLDGLKVDNQDWWFNVRPSNTEPLMRLNAEAKTQKSLDEIKTKVEALIRG